MRGPRPFRFGVINETPLAPAAWRAQVQAIEAQGYATFLIRDHFVPDYFGDQFAPFTALMAAASVTTTLRVGTLVFDNDYRHPVLLAKEAATLDLLSDGRLELGLGAGWLRREYDVAGLPYDAAGTRITRLEEALRVIKGLFADEPLTFAGQHYAVAQLDGYPKPLQRPHPPILIGGGQRRMLTLAGREADIVSILGTSVASGAVDAAPTERLAAAVEEKLSWVRAGAGERYADIELSLIPSVIFADDRRACAAQLAAERGWTDVSVDDVLAMPSLLIGSADDMVEQLIARRERFGFSYYVVSDEEAAAFAPVVRELAGR